MKKIILGIESTAHTLGIGIVDSDGNILANEKSVYTSEKSGMIPSELAEHHVKEYEKVITSALNKANLSIKDIDVIAYSRGPGIGHALKIGAFIAASIKEIYNKPVVGVNHCISHLTIGELTTGLKNPVLLYASGANTQVIAYDEKKYRIFGETLDIGVGNFIDSFARAAGLGFPGGPKIEELAKKGKKLIELPYSVKGMDVSFSGIYTFLVKKLNEEKLEDLAYSLQEYVFSMLVEVTERAMAHLNRDSVILGGGVALNSRLQEMLRLMAEQRNAKFAVPRRDVLPDNGVMIAWQGWLEYSTRGEDKEIIIKPYERTDEVIVTWKD
ncbi:MAG: KEOPS complex N(6)-L-threonylcarbamoyladenine synthase Kae1 [Candidatus Woesearchaeota archaeon]